MMEFSIEDLKRINCPEISIIDNIDISAVRDMLTYSPFCEEIYHLYKKISDIDRLPINLYIHLLEQEFIRTQSMVEKLDIYFSENAKEFVRYIGGASKYEKA